MINDAAAQAQPTAPSSSALRARSIRFNGGAVGVEVRSASFARDASTSTSTSAERQRRTEALRRRSGAGHAGMSVGAVTVALVVFLAAAAVAATTLLLGVRGEGGASPIPNGPGLSRGSGNATATFVGAHGGSAFRQRHPAAHSGGKEGDVNGDVANKGRRAATSRMIYGTAWKSDRTSDLVFEAVAAGFRHIDTANFPRDYNESGVGEGWNRAIAASAANSSPPLRREDLFLQTKFTPVDFHKQDRTNLPYDGDVGEEEQIRQSVEGSLHNLRTDYLDAVLLHSAVEPIDRLVRAWKVLESYVDGGTVRYLGICSVHDPEYFRQFHGRVRIKPAIVQNRFHRNRGFDVTTRLRPLLLEYGVVSFQTFWTLTGNGPTWRRSAAVREVAEKYGMTPAQIVLAFVVTLGGSPLSGTKKVEHMEQDLEAARRAECGEVFRRSSLDADASGDGDAGDAGGWNNDERKVIADALGMKALL